MLAVAPMNSAVQKGCGSAVLSTVFSILGLLTHQLRYLNFAPLLIHHLVVLSAGKHQPNPPVRPVFKTASLHHYVTLSPPQNSCLNVPNIFENQACTSVWTGKMKPSYPPVCRYPAPRGIWDAFSHPLQSWWPQGRTHI